MPHQAAPSAPMVLNLGPWSTRQLIAPLFWFGWLLTILAAEAWIRLRR